MDVLLPAHLLEYFRPYGGAHLANMRFFEKKHKCAGLPNAAADTERDLIIQNCSVVWQLEQIKLLADLQLFLERFSVDADPHRR